MQAESQRSLCETSPLDRILHIAYCITLYTLWKFEEDSWMIIRIGNVSRAACSFAVDRLSLSSHCKIGCVEESRLVVATFPFLCVITSSSASLGLSGLGFPPRSFVALLFDHRRPILLRAEQSILRRETRTTDLTFLYPICFFLSPLLLSRGEVDGRRSETPK